MSPARLRDAALLKKRVLLCVGAGAGNHFDRDSEIPCHVDKLTGERLNARVQGGDVALTAGIHGRTRGNGLRRHHWQRRAADGRVNRPPCFRAVVAVNHESELGLDGKDECVFRFFSMGHRTSRMMMTISRIRPMPPCAP